MWKICSIFVFSFAILLGAAAGARAENTSGVPIPDVPNFPRTSPRAYGTALAKYMDRYDTGWKDHYAKSKMTLYDARGDFVRREVIQLVREGAKGDKSILRFRSPADIRGVAALTHEHPRATDDSWLYLPASRRVRRISGANRSASFQGTEFTYEDLSSLVVEKYGWRYLEESTIAVDGKSTRISKVEAKPNYRDSGYSKLIVYLNQRLWRVERVDYFDHAGRPLKVLTNSKWRKHHGRFWRPMRVDMRNLQTQKRTVLDISSMFLNLALHRKRDGSRRSNLKESQFTRAALATH